MARESAIAYEIKKLREFAFDTLAGPYNLDAKTDRIALALYHELDSDVLFGEDLHWVVDMVIDRAKEIVEQDKK